MTKIGDFGEVGSSKKPDQDICDFGENCAEKQPERASARSARTVEKVASANIRAFGEDGEEKGPEETICAFGENCEESPAKRNLCFRRSLRRGEIARMGSLPD